MQCIRRLRIVSRIKVLAVFQPHLLRTSDFADDFAKSLSNLMILLMDIYPRELLWKELRQNGCQNGKQE
jgi:UDP-N-acetylmuramate-alanine ligase